MPASLLEAPLIGGLEQGTGEPHLPPGSFLNIRNARQIRTGAIEKRPGGTNLGQFPASSAIDHLFARGEDVVGIGSPSSAAYYPAQSYSPSALALGNSAFQGSRLGGEALLTRQPIDVTQDNNPSDQNVPPPTANPTNLTMRPAMAYGSGVYVYVVVVNNRIEVSIEDASTGASIVSRAKFSTFLLFSCDYAIPVITNGLLIVIGREHGTANIKAASMSLSAISAGFGALSTLISDAKTTQNATQFDAVANGTGFTLAYFDNATHVSIKNYTSAFVQTATDQEICSANANRISMGLANGLVAVAVNDTNGTVAAFIWTTALALTSVIGTTIFTSTSIITAVCIPMDATNVAYIATMNTSNVVGTKAAYINSSTAAISTTGFTCTFAALLSKPFVESGLLYAWLASCPMGTFPQTPLLHTAVLCEFSGMGSNTFATATQAGFRVVGSDCPRFLGAIQGAVNASLVQMSAFPLSVVSPAADVYEIIVPFLENSQTGFFARERADFSAMARWQADSLGNLTMLSSGPLQYDGSSLVENGFVQAPVSITVSAVGSGGIFASGLVYWYSVCYVYQDASGNVTRSSPSTPVSVTTTGAGAGSNSLTLPNTSLTWKQPSITGLGTSVQDSLVRIEIYRSTANPAVAAGGAIQMYLMATVNNSTVLNTTNFVDTGVSPYDDTSVAAKPTLYTFGGLLPNVSPPSFIALCAHKSRVFGIAPDRKTIWYSKQYTSGEGINFCDTFTLSIDDPVKLVALASMDDKLVIFSDRRIYFLQGDGPLDTGLQSDYGLPIRIATDVGCIDRRSIVLTPEGLFFQSNIGIYLLDRGLNLTYIGQPILDELARYPQVTSAVLHPTQPWVYFNICTAGTTGLTGNGERLVYDYRVKKWYIDGPVTDVPPHGGGSSPAFPWVPVSAVRTPTAIYWLSIFGNLWAEDTTGTVYTDNGAWVTMQFEVGWMKANGTQGYQTTRSGVLLGKWLSAHDAYIDWRSGYSNTYERGAPFLDNAIQSQARAPTEQFLVEVDREQQAVAMRFTDAAPTGGTIGTGQGARFFAMTFAVDPIDDTFRVDPIQQGG